MRLIFVLLLVRVRVIGFSIITALSGTNPIFQLSLLTFMPSCMVGGTD